MPMFTNMPLDAIASEILTRELDYMQERNVESIIIVFRRRDDGLVELGAITSAPAHGSVPVAPSMHDVRQMLDSRVQRAHERRAQATGTSVVTAADSESDATSWPRPASRCRSCTGRKRAETTSPTDWRPTPRRPA